MKKETKDAKIARLERELADEKTINSAAQQCYEIVLAGIRQALRIEKFPDFYRLYGDGLYATGVATFLCEEMDKIRNKDITTTEIITPKIAKKLLKISEQTKKKFRKNSLKIAGENVALAQLLAKDILEGKFKLENE